MDVTFKPKIEVVISPTGVDVVRLYGGTWADEEAALALFERVRPLLRQVRWLLALPADAQAEAPPS